MSNNNMNYDTLTNDDTLQPGDEFRSEEGGWYPVRHLIGLPAGAITGLVGKKLDFRRPFLRDVGYEILAESETLREGDEYNGLEETNETWMPVFVSLGKTVKDAHASEQYRGGCWIFRRKIVHKGPRVLTVPEMDEVLKMLDVILDGPEQGVRSYKFCLIARRELALFFELAGYAPKGQWAQE
jgi:hypothetical protein